MLIRTLWLSVDPAQRFWVDMVTLWFSLVGRKGLDERRNSAERLSSVGGKPWADDACLAGLVRAIDDLLKPQAYLCSMGADRGLHGDEIMRMTSGRVSR